MSKFDFKKAPHDLKYPINGEPGWEIEPVREMQFDQFVRLDDVRDVFGGGMINGIPEPIFFDDFFHF